MNVMLLALTIGTIPRLQSPPCNPHFAINDRKANTDSTTPQTRLRHPGENGFMTLRTKFDMYLAPASQACFAALTDHLTTILAGHDMSSATGSYDIGQMCGIDFAKATPGRYHYLATMVVDNSVVPEGSYNSHVITPQKDGLRDLKDFNPARHVMAINEPGSFSGAAVFDAHLRRHGIAGFDNAKRSGGHLNSIAMVARGDAHLASIDRLSFELARHDQPENVAKVTVIDETPFYPSPPFVADGGLSRETVTRLTDALLAFRQHDAWQEMCELLGIRDLTIIDPADYTGMDRPE